MAHHVGKTAAALAEYEKELATTAAAAGAGRDLLSSTFRIILNTLGYIYVV